MEVKEFLDLFKSDLPDINKTGWSFDDYLDWNTKFKKKTSKFQRSVKESYFEQTYKLINDNNFSTYYGPLSEFSYLGLFNVEDETKFTKLIELLIEKIDDASTDSRIEPVLSYTQTIADFLLHEYYSAERLDLQKKLVELRHSIMRKSDLDKEKTCESVIRFLDSIT